MALDARQHVSACSLLTSFLKQSLEMLASISCDQVSAVCIHSMKCSPVLTSFEEPSSPKLRESSVSLTCSTASETAITRDVLALPPSESCMDTHLSARVISSSDWQLALLSCLTTTNKHSVTDSRANYTAVNIWQMKCTGPGLAPLW